MRKYSFDGFELGERDREESLEVAFGSKRQFATSAKFLAECGTEAAARTAANGSGDWQDITKYVQHYLKTFQNIEFPEIDQAHPVVLCNEWNDVEVAVETMSEFAWYHWLTTA
jgi:hypothetical protein